ncbi:MAG: ABC transporter permease subunit [Erysipelotrichaceae bacterium]|nr:ABC transporter permease subunit [Erysipelotrichaceae bacterium]
MKRRKLLSLITIIVLWQAIAMILNKPVIVPFPLDVFKVMIRNIGDSSFYSALFATILRMLRGLIAAFVLALAAALTAGIYSSVEDYLSPFINIIKTVPNVSYIVIILILFGSERSVTIITFFILFPSMYSSFLLAMHSVDRELLDVARLEPITFCQKIRYVYWPEIVPAILTSLKTSFGLGFKVSIMAEILGAVRTGVGREMSVARTYVEMDQILAWTLWIIIVSLLADQLFDFLLRKYQSD